MGKRSNFERIDKDFYPTIDPRAVQPLQRYTNGLIYNIKYYEPCVGAGHLRNLLDSIGFECVGGSDILTGTDALTLKAEDLNGADLIITNPPWSRPLLHPLIAHFSSMKPTLLLFDADWMHTKQARPYMRYCHSITSVGRLTWIEGTKMTGKDNCAWYYFDQNLKYTYTAFFTGENID